MTVEGLLPWGRYPDCPQHGCTPAWRESIPHCLTAMAGDAPTLAFGNGRSYGDSCLAVSDGVVHTAGLDRFISADWARGRVRAEAGVTLGELIAVALPQGWFPPVTPGTRHATLGGAVANDVHGKNHHRRGTFGRHVTAVGLYRSDEGRSVLDDPAGERFRATVGGFGLTGIIEWVEIQLVPVTSAAVAATTHRFGDIAEFLALSRELDDRHEYSVAWVDCLAAGRNAGRGLLTVGDHAGDGSLEPAPASGLPVPFTPPFSLVQGWSTRLFNALVYRRPRRLGRSGTVRYDRFFYPLDRLDGWNRLYGRRGFQQLQCVVPEAEAGAALPAMLRAVRRHGSGSMLAVLKRFGDVASPGLLSFPRPGVTLALDFPERGAATARVLEALDNIVEEAGGRLYPAKDAHMAGRFFRDSYPEWRRLEAQRDPALMSRFWQRVTR